ncbi:MAG: leishmanolysin-related zinc metalloendopeptidase [Thermoanaerobaculia bacterium]
MAVVACGGKDSTTAPPQIPVPSSVAFVTGAAQAGLAGTVVPVAPVAQVKDQFGKPMAGVSVFFSIAAGDGTVASTAVVTDASGNATSPTWTLGKDAVPQQLRATAGGFSSVISATITTSYSVDLRFLGPPMPDSAAAAFEAAAARISGSIIGDVVDIVTTTPIDLGQCGVTGVTLPADTIDDVIIYASVAPIDGPGKVLASSGPCFVRTPGNPLPVIGVMMFDSADINGLISSHTLRDVIQHEMLHVVGFGTIWTDENLLADTGTVTEHFSGPAALAACHTVGGTSICATSVPVENTGGPGTAGGHWRESVFGNELMTGFINTPPNPYSVVTVQSLADLGYQVNPAAADAYVIPGQSAIRQGSSAILGEMSPLWETVGKPGFLITRNGHISRVERR